MTEKLENSVEARTELTSALMVTPIPPLQSGLSTYALRIIKNTRDLANWKVAYPEGGDPDSLPEDVDSFPVNDLENRIISEKRFFQLGNSPECFDILRNFYRFGGDAIFHDLVLHHMLRKMYLDTGNLEEYRRELVFEYGPKAKDVEKLLSKNIDSIEYDRKLKMFPLIGRAIHSASSLICLNETAASVLGKRSGGREVIVIGHPLNSIETDLLDQNEDEFQYIGIVGGYHSGRNLEILKKSIRLLRKNYPGIRLVLIGGGYPPQNDEKIVITGRLPEKEYQEWIRRLTIAVDIRFPHCYETSGSLMEVMRAGIPAVVSASGSFINLPSDAVIRLPVNGMNETLAKAVSFLLENPSKRKSMGLAASVYAEDQGSVERLRREWKKLLKREIYTTGVSDNAKTCFPIAAAWLEEPEGFRKNIRTSMVSWSFNGTANINIPESCGSCLVTAWGQGYIKADHDEYCLKTIPSVFEIAGNKIIFSGSGAVSQITYKGWSK